MPIKISQQQQQQQQHQQQYNDYNSNNNSHHIQHVTNSQFLPQQQSQGDYDQGNRNHSHYQQHQHQQHQQQQQHMMLQTIKQQLLQNNVITRQELQHILFIDQNKQQQQQQQNHNHHLTHKQSLYAIITHLTASIIQHNQHMQQNKQLHLKQVQELKQNISKNDHCAISALEMFYQMTNVLGRFSQLLYWKKINNNKEEGGNDGDDKDNDINNNTITIQTPFINNNNLIPIQIYKLFRQVYEITQQLSSIFNKYLFTDQEILEKRNLLLQKQIQNMQTLFDNQAGLEIMQQQQQQLDLQEENIYSLNNNKYAEFNNINNSLQSPSTFYPHSDSYPHPYPHPYPVTHPHPTNLPTPTSQYILSLREQINHLHQTLLKNDQQFTYQIQNYNKTIRQLSQTIKAYEKQIAKIIHYELKIEQLQKTIIKFREDKYKNEIVIENMARKIRKYERDINGDNAFLSPKRQRLISSPQTRYSMLNSKLSLVGSNSSLLNNINNINNNLNNNLNNNNNNNLSNNNRQQHVPNRSNPPPQIVLQIGRQTDAYIVPNKLKQYNK